MVGDVRSGIERIQSGLPSRREANSSEAECVGERSVFAFRVEDGAPARSTTGRAEQADRPIQQCLDGGRLAGADHAEHQDVR